MKASAEGFGYETEIIEIQKINNSWIDTIYWRADFVQSMLNKHKRPVVWLDCDAIVEQDPVLFEDFQGDFGAHVHDFHWRRGELLGGTMYFAHNHKCFELVEKWVHFNKTLPKQVLSQLVLKAAVKHWDGKFVEFPPTYCQIFDHMKDCGVPVISHHQASRRFRNGS